MDKFNLMNKTESSLFYKIEKSNHLYRSWGIIDNCVTCLSCFISLNIRRISIRFTRVTNTTNFTVNLTLERVGQLGIKSSIKVKPKSILCVANDALSIAWDGEVGDKLERIWKEAIKI
jgi:hypothetical protein